MFVKYKYKVIDDDYVNNLKELFQKKMSKFFVRQLQNTFRNEMVVLDTP